MAGKKRVLFVDDELLILESLRRSLRHLRIEWEMDFAESGAQALGIMEGKAFDVVVADMRMPGMSGADLLGEVMKRHPETVRIILSGQADQDAILRCVGSIHRFLAKPCGTMELQAALCQTAAIEDTLANEKLRRLVSRMERLPSVPKVYRAIVEMLRDPEVSVDDVAGVVAQDPGMTAGVLKVVNSAFFGLRQHIAAPAEAVSYLGLDTLKSLVLAIGAFAQFKEVRIDGFSLSGVWHHSLAVAAAAQAIAREEKAEQRTADECFAAGLLHDVGKLVLAENCAAEFEEVTRLARKHGIPWHVAESRVFGLNHAELAGSLLGLWALPGAVVEAIAHHHAPGRSPDRKFTPLAAVHAADVLVHQQAQTEADMLPPEPDNRFLEAAHLLPRWERWRAAVGKSGDTPK